MSLETRIVALAQIIGGGIKSLRTSQGTLSALNTTTKTSLVAAINELIAMMGSAGASIDDNAGNGSTAVTWSADKIFDSSEAAKASVKADLTNGASAANKGSTAGTKSGSYNLGTDLAPVALTASNVLATILQMASMRQKAEP